MAPIKISDRVDHTIKEFLLPDLQENFWRMSKHVMSRMIGMEKDEAPSRKSGSPLQPRIKNVAKTAIGRNFEVEHLTTPFGGGVHAAAENVALRQGKFYSNRSVATAKFLQGSFELTRQVIAATRGKEFALAEEIQKNAEGAIHSMHWNLNRMLVGPANGVLCIVNGAVAGATTVNVDNGGTEETPPTQHINPGDVLLIGTAAQVAAGTADEVVVASVTDDNTFELTANATLADNDVVVRADVYSSGYQEVTGLASLIAATGTVQGVDKAANSWFQSNVTAVGGALTVAAITNLVMKARRFAIDPTALFLVGNSVQWSRYAALLTTTKSYDADKFAGNLAGGVEGLTFFSPDGAMPFFIDDMVPDGTIYVVDPNAYMWGEMEPFQFAEDAVTMNGVPGQRKSGYLNYEFAFFMFGEFAQLNAKSSGKLTGITA